MTRSIPLLVFSSKGIDLYYMVGVFQQAKGGKTVYSRDFDTYDIINLVLEVDHSNIEKDTFDFVQRNNIKGTYNDMRKIWYFVKRRLKYVEDSVERQFIKTPSRSWQDRNIGTDCKSFTIFMTSIFKNVGIDYIIRFTSNNPKDKRPHHVYPVAIIDGKEVIMDAVYHSFDREADHLFKIDKRVNRELAVLNGIGNLSVADVIRDSISRFQWLEATEGQMNLHLVRESLLIDYLNETNQEIKQDLLTKAFHITKNIDSIHESDAVTGIGAIDGFFRFNRNKKRKARKPKTKKRSLKTRVLERLLKIVLPKVASFFLYVNVEDNLIARQRIVKAKKSKQLKIVATISKLTGIPTATLKVLIENAVKKRFKQTSNALMRKILNPHVGGVLAVLSVAKSLLPSVIAFLERIFSIFGFEDQIDIKGGSPDESDIIQESGSVQDNGVLTRNESGHSNAGDVPQNQKKQSPLMWIALIGFGYFITQN